MNYKVELEHKKNQILIVDKVSGTLTHTLQRELQKYDNEVYVSPYLGGNLEKFTVLFIFNHESYLEKLLTATNKKVIFICTKAKTKAIAQSEIIAKLGIKYMKVVYSDKTLLSPEDLEKLLWFSFSDSPELFLPIYSGHGNTTSKNKVKSVHTSSHLLRLKMSPKKIGLLLLLFMLIYHVLFILPLLFSVFFNIKALGSIKNKRPATALHFVNLATRMQSVSTALYTYSRPTFLILGIVVHPDNLLQLNEKTTKAIRHATYAYEKGKNVISALTEKEKDAQQERAVRESVNQIQKDISVIEENLIIIHQKIPELGWFPSIKKAKQEVKEMINLLSTFQKVTPYFDTILGHNGEKKYLLLFANNMELRPGGGFIGSFGILKIKNYSITELTVYDVYDADGQLVGHIDPPQPIERYLQQPHWFLRDSAFSPDFPQNYQQAKLFLNKEMKIDDFDGGVILTTTAVQNILAAVGDLYIADFKETVNKDNFYIKAQLYAEKDFFPGSLQKKRFLSSVFNQLLIRMENSSVSQVTKAVKKSLDEKQIAVYFEDESLQRVIDSLYWSGRMIEPRCAANSDNCVIDYLFPVDANLGVNKANFFINRTISLDVKIDSDGQIHNTLTLSYQNNSPNEVFPGGTYKNYLQVIIPQGSAIREITRNDTLVENYDEEESTYKIIGLFSELKPGSSSQLKINYQLKPKIQKSQGVYQLIMQKQLGSSNSDLNVSLYFPKNVYVVNHNFSGLVKNNSINYNTTLTADKIFFLDIIKE